MARFKGTLPECVKDFAARMKGKFAFRNKICDFFGANKNSGHRWFEDLNMPVGTYLLKMRLLLELNGYEVAGIKSVDPALQEFGELIALEILSVEQARVHLKFSKIDSVLNSILGKTGVSEKKMQEFRNACSLYRASRQKKLHEWQKNLVLLREEPAEMPIKPAPVKTTGHLSHETALRMLANMVRAAVPLAEWIASEAFTPEERRRGINAAFLDINDIGLVNALHTKIRDNLDTEDETTQQSSIDERDTFMLGFTEHLFLLSKYATRQIPTLVSPFNPFVVAGFPALIIDPIRSILGQVEMVSHNIDNRGNATTSIQLSSPRFWDEGDIWYWLGGWRGTDDFIRFPPWYNRKFIATNNIILDSERRLTSRFDSLLDITYQGLLGCKGIRYRSINADRIDSPLLDPATGAVIDYNAAIDGRKINEKGDKRKA